MPAISPARAANVATHAWTKLYDEIMSWISGVYECRSHHAWLALREANSTTAHICTACKNVGVTDPTFHSYQTTCILHTLRIVLITEWLPWRQSLWEVWKINCKATWEAATQFILQPHYTDIPQNICEGVITNVLQSELGSCLCLMQFVSMNLITTISR